MNLVDMYRAAAAEKGSEPAITFAQPAFEGVTLTWSDIMDRADALSEELRDAGVGAETRVATMAVDHPNTVPAALAMWQLNAIPILVDPLWGDSIQSGVISHSRADVVLQVGDRLEVRPV